MQEYQNINMSVVLENRSSRRLSGRNLEMPPLVKGPSLYRSRLASRQASKQPTREPTPEPDDGYLQAQAQTEYEEQDEPETPPKIQKRKALETQVIYPTPSHVAPEQEWEDDPPNRPLTDADVKQVAELSHNLTNLHRKWDPKTHMINPSAEGISQLATIINDLIRDNPMPWIAGMHPKTPRKLSWPSAVYSTSRSAPKKPAGYLSRTVSTLGLPRLCTSLFGTSNPILPQPTLTPSISAAPLPMQHPANFLSSSSTSGPTPFGFHQMPDITLNFGNQNTSQ